MNKFRNWCFALGLLFTFILIIGLGSATQQPANWWNETGAFSCSDSCNMTSETNITNSTFTLSTGADVILSGVNITFNGTDGGGELIISNSNPVNLLINNSYFYGNNGGTNNRFDMRHGNFSIYNTEFYNFFIFKYDIGTGFNTLLENVTMGGFNSGIVSVFNWNNSRIYNSRFENITGDNAVKIVGEDNEFINNTLTNASDWGVAFLNGAINNTMTGNNVSNTGSACLVNQGANYSLIDYNTATNCGGYGIDVFRNSSHVIVEYNNITNTSSTGIAFSVEDVLIGNKNFTSRWNRIFNSSTNCIRFNEVNDGYSYYDYGNGCMQNGMRVTNSLNINVYNFTTEDIVNESFFIANTNNSYIDNLTVINSGLESILVENSNNITFNDSLQDSNTHYLRITGVGSSSNISFNNLRGWSFDIEIPESLNVTLDNYLFMESYGSASNTIQLNNLTNALIYFSNGTTKCQDVSTCDNNQNITLQPNNYSYVFDNFNFTYGQLRSPSIVYMSGNDYQFNLVNGLSDTINGTNIYDIPMDCSSILRVVYNSTNGIYDREPSYTCSDGLINFTIFYGIEPGVTGNVINIYKKTLGSSSGGSTYYTDSPVPSSSGISQIVDSITDLLSGTGSLVPEGNVNLNVPIVSGSEGSVSVSKVTILFLVSLFLFILYFKSKKGGVK